VYPVAVDSDTTKPTESTRAKWPLWLALFLTALVVLLHLVRAIKAGGLWRDEAAAVQLATLPRFSDVVRYFPHEAFPLLFPTIVRTWAALTRDSDVGYRIFGFLVGVSNLAALWWAVRVCGKGIPFWGLSLLSFNLAFLQWGDSVRGYGLGTFFVLLTCGLVWRLGERPTRGRAVAAALGAIASVQCVLSNSVLLLAICLGGIAVALRRKEFRVALLVLGIGGVAAVSLLPYWGPLSSARDWDLLVRGVPVSDEKMLYILWHHFTEEALEATGRWHAWIWAALVFAAVLFASSWRLFKQIARDERDKVFFAMIIILSAAAGLLCFFFVLHYPTQAWYYLGFMALVAVCLDIMFGTVRRPGWLPGARVGLAMLIAAASLPSVWRQIVTRQTNMDLIAARLNQAVGPNDLVVMAPWHYGISFQRYYRGPARWITVPLIEFHRFHRFDLIKPYMMLPDQDEPIRSVLEQIDETLKSGHRVWMVGQLHFSPPGAELPSVSAAPDPTWGWLEAPHDIAWVSRVGAYLEAPPHHGEDVSVNEQQPINPVESPPLTVWVSPPERPKVQTP
jgi:hypothetical protein